VRRAYVGIGANVGEAEGTVRSAVVELSTLLDDLHVSSLYRTAPLHHSDQRDFVNAVVSGLWSGSAEALLDTLHELEAKYGRDRSAEFRFGPRRLDLDLLVLGDLITDRKDLSLPHPRMEERRFVLEPLVEVDPELLDPRSGKSFAETLADLEKQRVERMGELW
jgi:2-amino-4-hydroxy-6-hydroxymethyldihydropteridine diphosphokinase